MSFSVNAGIKLFDKCIFTMLFAIDNLKLSAHNRHLRLKISITNKINDISCFKYGEYASNGERQNKLHSHRARLNFELWISTKRANPSQL